MSSHYPHILRHGFRLFPGSLAATTGIAFAFFSSSYLDVSVHWVDSSPVMNYMGCAMRLPYSGISGSKLVASSPKRIAGICALLRL